MPTPNSAKSQMKRPPPTTSAPMAEQEGADAAEEGSGLEPVEVVVHGVHASTLPVRAGVPDRLQAGPCPSGQAEQSEDSQRRPSAEQAEDSSWGRSTQVATRRAGPPAPGRRARRRLPPDRTVRLARDRSSGAAQEHREPAQVDRDAEHRVDRPRRRPSSPQPLRHDRSQRHHLGDEADHARRQPGEREQGQAERRRRAPGARATGPVYAASVRRASAPPAPRRAATTCDHGEGDAGSRRRRPAGSRRRPRPPPRTRPTSGSTTQPACATVDQASSRTASSWRRAMTLPSVMLTTASDRRRR